MFVLLPPSETKRDGGAAGSLELASLRFPHLAGERRSVLDAVAELSLDVAAASAALGLGPTQAAEIDRNRGIPSAPLMPAIERYTGVLYDGLQAELLTESEREFANTHVVVHSALFGLVSAGDAIPAYRLSHNSRLPGLSLGRHWRPGISAELAQRSELLLDLRSEAYASLGPTPRHEGSYYIRVVSQGPSGRRTALSHFNKKAKGEFTRAVIAAGVDHADVVSLLAWAAENGIVLERSASGELDLVV